MSESRGGVVPLLVITAAFAAGMAALVLLRAPGGAFAELGEPVPDFSLSDLGGEPISLAGQRGRVVFVNFWATWCPPCREEAPSLERLYRELEGEGFTVLAISVDAASARDEVDAFRQEFALSFPILLDPDRRTHDSFGVTGVPETYLIDAQGRLAERFIGPRDWDQPRFGLAVRRLLAARGSAAVRATGQPAREEDL